MAYTIGRVDFVEIRWSGDTLITDHPEALTTLQVGDVTDFSENGGTLLIAEDTYTYNALDPELETITLDTPTVVAYETGELVKVQPEAIGKTAYCYIDDSDDTVPVRVPHSMKDRLAEGDRDTDQQETLTLYMDGAQWVIQDIVDQPVLIDPGYLDPDGPPLPPPLIPGEGWEYMGPIAPESILTGTLQSRLQIGEEIWVVRYTDPTDPEAGADPNSGIISITPDDGLRLRIPNQDDPEAEPETLAHLPTALYDEAGNQVTAVFRGRADFSIATAQQFQATGVASNGDVSSIATSAELQLNNAVTDPSSEPNVTFGPRTRSWAVTPSGYIENGWGVSGNNVVFAVRNTGPNGGTRFRFINPTTGLTDHDVQCQISPSNVAGITVCGGYIYMVFRALGKWSLSRFNMNGQIDGNGANITPWVNGAGQVCIGSIDDEPTLAYRDVNGRIRIRQYAKGATGLLDNPWTWATNHYDSTGRVLGGFISDPDINRGYLFSGSRIVQLDDLMVSNEAGSLWSGIGSLAGGGFLPDGTLAAFDGQGTCATYNGDPSVDVDTTSSFATTLANTTSGRESGMSPPVTRTWTAKSFATVQADRLFPGTNQVRFYGSTTGDTYTDMYRLGETTRSVVLGPLTRIPTTGLQPPETSQFTSTGEIPGKIVSQALIPGTSRRAASIDAQGHAEFHGLTRPWVSRGNGSGQALGDSTWVRVNWPDVFENTTEISYFGGVFTIGHSGVYVITAQATITGFPNNTRFACRVVRNDVSIARTGQHATGTTFCSTGIYGFHVRLLAGDRVWFEVHQNSGTLQTINAEGDQNWIQVTRIQV